MSSSAEGDESKRDDELDHDEDRAAILQRRRRFVATALGGIAMATSVLADCGSTPQPCLRAAQDSAMGDGDATSSGTDAQPQPCLSQALDVPTVDASDAQPQPCLDMAMGDASMSDASPQPCLSPPAPDGSSGGSDAEPAPCLRMVPPDGG
jgi:hypothetical protein